MTRINVVQPDQLCDQHLLAEHRELTRIPNYILKKEGNVKLSNLLSYTLGKGHILFFRDKLLFLYLRYISLHYECIKRGFLVINKWPAKVKIYHQLWNNYKITKEDIIINKARIAKRMPLNPRFSHYKHNNMF